MKQLMATTQALCLEWQPRDLWVGAYWEIYTFTESMWHGGGIRAKQFDLYICLLPCLPIHYTRITRRIVGYVPGEVAKRG